MKTASRWLFASFLIAAIAVLLLIRLVKPNSSANSASRPASTLLVYCAAGLKTPVTDAVAQYQSRFGVRVEIQFGGSGTLLSNLRVARRGDVFIAADSDYLSIAQSNALIAEVLPIATLSPVIAVQRDNPKSIRSLTDFLRDDVAVAFANPDATAVGRLARSALGRAGVWKSIASRAKVFKPTVNDVANDIRLGAVDAGIVWDATLAQYPNLGRVEATELNTESALVSAGILTSSENSRAALHFARFLAARDAGLPHFAQAGYRVVDGDAWADVPEVVLYSGGVNRVAIEPALRRFEEREGIRITRVYNGCGILTAQIRAGQRPDAYFACDTPFIRGVQEHFRSPVDLSQTHITILTAQGNPHQVRSLADLATPGLRVGLANESQSALGAISARLLRQARLDDAIRPNVVVETPTADLLVNQLRAGGLDAAIVFQANASSVRDTLTSVPIPDTNAFAIQPFAIGQASRNSHLMGRLLQALQSSDSRRRFEETGFTWRFQAAHAAP